LWEAADELRANSKLQIVRVFGPRLGLIFLRYADQKSQRRKETHGCGERTPEDWEDRYQAAGCALHPEKAVCNIAESARGADIGKAINEAMKSIEAENEDLKDVLPDYNALEKAYWYMLRISRLSPSPKGTLSGRFEYFLGDLQWLRGRRGASSLPPSA